MSIPDTIFRAYDIRGKVGSALTPETMEILGRAIGSEALDEEQSSLLLARDARLSSPAFAEAMTAGILSTGCNVIDLGIAPSPLLYYATHTTDYQSGIIITGSHNPADYNGVKIVIRRQCLAEGQISAIRNRIDQQNFHSGSGLLSSLSISEDYFNRIGALIKLKNPVRVVIDCGNGVTANTAPELFTRLGCEVIPLFCTLDGHFPNHHPDPTVADNLTALIQEVKKHNADLGIAFDGDGDRLGLVTTNGNILNADKMLMAFARDVLADAPGSTIVVDIKSSRELCRLIENSGGNLILSKSGHSLVKRTMQHNQAVLGGEFSSHIFFKHRWYGFDDAQYAAARFLELMDKQNLSADKILDQLPFSVSTEELHIPVADDLKFLLMERLITDLKLPGAKINHLDGIRAEFDEGWGLIRASNTTPCLTVRFESDSSENLEKIIALFKHTLSKLHPELDLPF